MVSCFTVEIFLSVDTLFSLSLHDRETKPADRVLLYPKVFTVDIGQKASLVSREPSVFLHKACVYVNFYYYSYKHVVGRIFMYLPYFTFEINGRFSYHGTGHLAAIQRRKRHLFKFICVRSGLDSAPVGRKGQLLGSQVYYKLSFPANYSVRMAGLTH